MCPADDSLTFNHKHLLWYANWLLFLFAPLGFRHRRDLRCCVCVTETAVGVSLLYFFFCLFVSLFNHSMMSFQVLSCVSLLFDQYCFNLLKKKNHAIRANPENGLNLIRNYWTFCSWNETNLWNKQKNNADNAKKKKKQIEILSVCDHQEFYIKGVIFQKITFINDV